MAQNLDDFIGQFNGGYRPNRFVLTHTFGGEGNDGGDLQYHIRATSFPASTITTLNVPYRGRIFKMPGIRTYATWQITVLDDTNNLFEKYHSWSQALKEHKNNTTSVNNTDFETVMQTITVQQLDYNGGVAKEMSLIKAWPSNIGPIQFDMENNETLLTFTVDFEYQYSQGPGAVV
jgi:hypothetical protein